MNINLLIPLSITSYSEHARLPLSCECAVSCWSWRRRNTRQQHCHCSVGGLLPVYTEDLCSPSSGVAFLTCDAGDGASEKAQSDIGGCHVRTNRSTTPRKYHQNVPKIQIRLGACPRNSARGTRKPNSCGSTNSSRNAGTKLAGEQNRHRNSAAAILNEKHSPMPLSGVAWSRGAVKCYVSDTPVPTPLLFCPFRVARIGETRGLA